MRLLKNEILQYGAGDWAKIGAVIKKRNFLLENSEHKSILIGVCLDLGSVNEYSLRGDEAVPAQEPGGFCHQFF